MDDEETGRLAGHVLVDLLSALDDDPGQRQATADALRLAFARLNQIGALVVSFDAETEELEVDASGLMGGLVLTLGSLAWLLEEKADMSRTDAVLRVREILDHQA